MSRSKQIVALGVVVLVALGVGAGYHALVHRLGTHARVSQQPAAAAALNRSFRAIEDGEAQSPRDRWDPDYVVGMLDRDPQRLFAWVRDNTDWIAYRGELRGPVGVLMDRQGSSLDRAVLLATLLENAGQHVRLAHAELTRAEAVDLLPALAPSAAASAGAAPAAIAAVSAQVKAAAAKQGLDGAAIDATVGTGVRALLRRATDLQSRAMEETRRLLGTTQGPSADIARAKNLDAAQDALRDYWWVQWQKSDQSWVDLDPMRLKSGHVLPAKSPQETLDLKSLAAAPVHHEIALRVVTEQWSAQAITEHTVLDTLLRPSELIGQPIVLQFLPTQWLGDSLPKDKPTTARPARDWRAEVLEQHEWGVGLQVGREIVASAALAESGDPADASTQPVRGGPMAGLASAFSATMNDRETAGAPTAGRSTLSAVWLEYEIRVPGTQPRTFRRTVFDLLGPAARAAKMRSPPALDDAKKITRALALSMQSEILPLPCRLAPEFLAHLMAQTVLGNRQLFERAAGGDSAVAAEGADGGSAASAPPLSALYALALARMQWSPNAAQIFLARPNLLTSHHYFGERRDGIVIRHATDIVANEVSVDWSAANPFAARVAQGVLDTNAEILARVGEGSFGNTGEAYANNAPWVAIAPGPDAAALRNVNLPEETRGLIGADLASGYAILAPPSAVPMAIEPFSGWWRIDPATGDTLGFGANGWGVELTENSEGNSRAAQIMRYFNGQFAKKFFKVMATTYVVCLIPAVVSGSTEQSDDLEFKLGAIYAKVADDSSGCAGTAVVVSVLGEVVLPLLEITLARQTLAFAEGGIALATSESTPAVTQSTKATTYNGVAPPPCNVATAEETVSAATNAADEGTAAADEAIPNTERAPAQQPSAKYPGQWFADPPGLVGTPVAPMNPQYIDYQINAATANEVPLQQGYGQAANNADEAAAAVAPAEAAYRQATANFQQAQANAADISFEELQALREQEIEATTARNQATAASEAATKAANQARAAWQRATDITGHWNQLQQANTRLINAGNAKMAADQPYYADTCRPGGQYPSESSPIAQAKAAADQAYESAVQNWQNVNFGGASQPADQIQLNAGGDPLDATQAGQPANVPPQQVQINAGGNSLDATQRGQSGNTQQIHPVPPGTAAPPPNPYAPAAMAKSIAGVVSVGNILGGK